MPPSAVRERKRKGNASPEPMPNDMNLTPLPVVALRGMTAFPHSWVHLDVGRPRTTGAIQHAMAQDDSHRVLLIAQRAAETEEPGADDLFETGVIGYVREMTYISGKVVHVAVETGDRVRIGEWVQHDPFDMVHAVQPMVADPNPLQAEAALRALLSAYEVYTQLSGKVAPEVVSAAETGDPGRVADAIAGQMLEKLEQRQAILDEFDAIARTARMLAVLERDNAVLTIERDMREAVRKQIAGNHREYYLKEQMRAISKELGEGSEIDGLRERVAALPLSGAARTVVERELDRLAKLSSQSPEVGVIRTWIDLVCDLPWAKLSEDNLDLANARAVLDRDHHGLAKVKERICEYLAVLSLKKELKGPILCFVGPPGVGKTSIARSVAEALGRSFARISLGGMRDEAEIRGHRRTYIGAMAGRLIASLRTVGSRNPVILLDEIDKLASDFRGDPASALLEALDAEQNGAFSDHYLEIPFDLSRVLFITTANTMDTVPAALRDRLEVIELSGYTEDEKLRIAQDHLVPKQLEAHGLKKTSLKIKDEAVLRMVREYTRESGVRALERVIARVCRKAAVEVASGTKKSLSVGTRALEGMLGKPRYRYNRADAKAQIGMAMGLAWTGSGGDVLPVEVAVVPGKGVLQLTGSLGDVMKESAQAAHTWIRAHAERYGITRDFAEIDLHIHVPEGAVPKDGPSAGITLCTAMVSALSGKPARNDLAMTGEITLRGKVLPIGGLREKLLAARRAGITTVLIPADNRRDLDEIPANALEGLTVHEVSGVEQVLVHALLDGGRKAESR